MIGLLRPEGTLILWRFVEGLQASFEGWPFERGYPTPFVVIPTCAIRYRIKFVPGTRLRQGYGGRRGKPAWPTDFARHSLAYGFYASRTWRRGSVNGESRSSAGKLWRMTNLVRTRFLFVQK
jgi:hypothetical protein